MAELPSKVHLTSHPICLSIRGPSVYEDENHRTWQHLVINTGDDLQVQLVQKDISIENISFSTIPLTSTTMPLMWTLQLGSRYRDSMGQFWRIVHHFKENDMEEMALELMEDS